MERSAWLVTAWKLGRYYRTYPAYVEEEVTQALEDPSQFVRGPRVLSKRGTAEDDTAAFTVEDGRYVSAALAGRRVPIQQEAGRAAALIGAGRRQVRLD
jgi:hypothetical protein